MKRPIWLFCMSAMFLGFAQARLAAQNPCFTYTSNYADYESASTDGTSIYTTVSVDGNGSMTFQGGNGCGSFNYGSAVHTPLAVNVITAPDGTYVGGPIYGTPECPTCYISAINNQVIANVNPEEEYTFSYAAVVTCSVGGGLYNAGANWTLAVALNTFAWAYDDPNGSGDAEYNLACPNGNASATCGADHLHGNESFKWAEEFLLREMKNGVKYCTSGGPIIYLNTWPAPMPCR